ncbi:MAG: DUF1552 domain-containing protein [Deltaproteobacteria bacterium]|nr:DUF1552 domain-containing protein [Deltaproteobacteria bacterium]
MTLFPRPLSRRTFLRGAGGALVGLPLLNAMAAGNARAQSTLPRRFVLVWSGTCQTHGGLDRQASGPLPAQLPNGWAALAPMRARASIVSKLDLPIYIGAQTPPPGGAYNQQHGGTMAPIVAGVHALEHMAVLAGGHTIDQVIADGIGGGTRLPSLQVRTQAAGYGFGAAKGLVSARLENGRVRGLDPIASPQVLYDTLFSGFTPPSTGGGGGPTTPPPLSLALRKKKSVLDLILGDAQRLEQKLGGEDRARLEQHFTEIRALEQRLIPVTQGGTNPPPPPNGASTCAIPVDPGPDGPINTPGNFAGWSNETDRGDLQADLLAMALACDLTRSVSWMLTFDQSGLSSQHLSGATTDIHAVSHHQGGGQPEVEQNANWHVARYARLLQSLEALPEDGGTVLDRTCVVYVSAEGNNAHAKVNLTYSYAGCPDVLRLGQLVNANGAHPAGMMMAALSAVGLPSNNFGELGGGPPSGMMV